MPLRGRYKQEELALLAGARRAEAALKAEERRGRSTGSLSWRKARGELGKEGGEAAAGGGGGGGGGGGSGGEAAVGAVVRICGAVGAVVHGLCVEREGGEREGIFLENSQAPNSDGIVA